MRLAAKRLVSRSKVCKDCGRLLPLSEFPKNGRSRAGTPTVRPECRECHSNRNQRKYARDAERIKAKQAEIRAEKGAAYYAERARRWRERNPDYYFRDIEGSRRRGRIKASRRRALIAGAQAERIDPKIVFENSLGICGICGLAVAFEEFQVDHIVALARGGHHTYENVQAAHPICNYRKGAK